MLLESGLSSLVTRTPVTVIIPAKCFWISMIIQPHKTQNPWRRKKCTCHTNFRVIDLETNPQTYTATPVNSINQDNISAGTFTTRLFAHFPLADTNTKLLCPGGKSPSWDFLVTFVVVKKNMSGYSDEIGDTALRKVPVSMSEINSLRGLLHSWKKRDFL